MVKVPKPPATACWQKSRLSQGGACIEIAGSHAHVWVRDSKNPRGPALSFTRGGWSAFLAGVQCAEFDHGPPA